ncbi:ATP-binding protein [Aeromonas veronii]|uniref:ATP-binding protein n=1 Tax=Aeromonas veronii TaxID=654 RepID=UPI0014312125|nr:ATP-binding protein [Aeromonas veronii]NJI23813.1 ATP-binding protein [Aeromonas veronii]NJI34179.1 ATP-binding protein [Aeromonas veronii]
MSKVGHVLSSSPDKVSIGIGNLKTLEENKTDLQVGKFIKIEDGNQNYAVAIINNLTAQKSEKDGAVEWSFVIEASPIGALINNDDKLEFKRGTQVLPVPTEIVHTFGTEDLSIIFSDDSSFGFEIGRLSGNPTVPFCIDGDRFFGKHIGVVGSTGSGKSCAVSSLIQNAVGIANAKNANRESKKNSHVIIFDIHSEYSSAFTVDESENFSLNKLDVDNLKLPYWLMNAEELESIFIESNEQNSHNQLSQFKYAVILNKEKHNPDLDKVTYDSPVFFSIEEVYNYIYNKNNLTVYEKNSLKYFATLDEEIEYNEERLWHKIDFLSSTGNSKHETLGAKISKEGGFNGEFDRFISRLETKLNDKRLAFLLKPVKDDDTSFKTNDFSEVIKQFLGYIDKSNVTVVDLSGIPFEVLSITVSLISRLMFDFAFHYSKIRHSTNQTNDIPFLIVCEEAHNYIPKIGGAEFKASKKSIERIAKEGRKYGLSLMVVSQRPSEVSETIFSQCNNFIAMRLTNRVDQNYIKALLPDSSSSLIDLLPSLNQGEAFIVGDSVIIPSLVQLPKPNPEPKSASIDTYKEWAESWKDITFDKIVERWRKEG